MKLAIIDLDGVVCDNTARMAKAEEAKAACLAQFADDDDPTPQTYIRQEAMNAYWRTAFTPDLVVFDTLIDGVLQPLEQIEEAGYRVFFLTSRPESMRQATVDWFWSLPPDFVLLGNEEIDQLIMKPASQQFVKTITWKAGVVQMLAKLLNAKTVLFVDDDAANQDELSKYADSFGMLYLAKSLDEAVRLITK